MAPVEAADAGPLQPRPRQTRQVGEPLARQTRPETGRHGSRRAESFDHLRPDFDHIVAYRAAPDAPGAPLQLRKWDTQQPGNDALAQALKANLAAIGGTIYFETGDLQ